MRIMVYIIMLCCVITLVQYNVTALLGGDKSGVEEKVVTMESGRKVRCLITSGYTTSMDCDWQSTVEP